MVTFVKWIFSSKERAISILLSIALVGVVVYICKLKLDVADLEKTVTEQSGTIATQQADIEAAQATIKGLQATEGMCKTESGSINSLLNQCYARLAQYEADFAEIDEQMEAGKDDISIKEGRELYDVITRAQQESGASYINRQFDSLE